MSMYPFSYSAVIYIEIDPKTNAPKYMCESGMSFCDSFAEAASIIAERYGDDLVCIKDLTLYEEDTVILLPAEIIHNYATDIFHDNAQFRCNEFGVPFNPIVEAEYEIGKPTKYDAKIPIDKEWKNHLEIMDECQSFPVYNKTPES